jgi:hypothetical protein
LAFDNDIRAFGVSGDITNAVAQKIAPHKNKLNAARLIPTPSSSPTYQSTTILALPQNPPILQKRNYHLIQYLPLKKT